MKAYFSFMLCAALLAVVVMSSVQAAPFSPRKGYATATKYDAGNYPRACDCHQSVNKYPTAALSEYHYGDSPGGGAGPSCGACYALKPYSPGDRAGCDSGAKELVVKVVDLCPEWDPYINYSNKEWCRRTNAFNDHRAKVHFDVDMRFTNEWERHFNYATWRVRYVQVSCTQWAGYKDSQTDEIWDKSWCGGKVPNPQSCWCPRQNNHPLGFLTKSFSCAEMKKVDPLLGGNGGSLDPGTSSSSSSSGSSSSGSSSSGSSSSGSSSSGSSSSGSSSSGSSTSGLTKCTNKVKKHPSSSGWWLQFTLTPQPTKTVYVKNCHNKWRVAPLQWKEWFTYAVEDGCPKASRYTIRIGKDCKKTFAA